MRTKRFFYNSMTTAFYQIIVMIAGLITPRIMLNYYGSEINGLVSSISQFVIYFNLVEAGLSGAAIYALYKPLADQNYKAINAVVSAAKKFYTKAGYIFISLTIGLAMFYPLYLKTGALNPLSMSLLVLILGANGALEFFTLAKYRVLLSADQKTYVISLASLAQLVVNTLIIVVLGTMQVDIVILRFVALSSILMRSIILMGYTRKTYKFLNYKAEPDYRSLDKRWNALYLQILGAIQIGAPIVILTLIVKNLKLVSVYTIFNMVIVGINGVLSIFISGLAASFGDVLAKEETIVLQKAYSEFEFTYYSLITVVYSVAFVTIMPFIRIYTKGVTDVDYNISIVGYLFVLNGLLYNIKTPQGMLVISAGLFRETKTQTTIQGAIVVFGGIILAPFYGIVGVLIASIFSNLYRDIDLIFFIPNNVTHLAYQQTLSRIIRILISGVIIWFPFRFIDINPTGFVNWMLNALVVGAYSVLIVVSVNFIFEKTAMKDVFTRVLRMVKR